METVRDAWPHSGRRAVRPLKVVVVGGGIGGLTAGIALAQTGHSVTILESAEEISDIGAGIQIAPNASRVLHRLGLLEEVMALSTMLQCVSVRRYTSDDELASFPLMPSNGFKYGMPMGVVHRADLQGVLLRKAQELKCEILTSHEVIAVHESFQPQVRVRNRATGATLWVAGDLVIAADGIKSVVRRQMLQHMSIPDNTTPTGDAAYRLLIPRDRIKHDEQLLAMLNQDVAMRYMGPGGHVMAYPVRNNAYYNLVLLHPAGDKGGRQESWTSRGSREDMLSFYSGWSPAIKKWLSYADEEILEWKLYSYPDLPTWTQGAVTLLGDACHPMLPYVAQGAANAMEDAAVLATALTCTADVHLALEMYQAVRKQRAEKITASGAHTARVLHLPDGPDQEARDESIIHPETSKASPDKWSNVQWQDFMWGVDVMDLTLRLWANLSVTMQLKALALGASPTSRWHMRLPHRRSQLGGVAKEQN